MISAGSVKELKKLYSLVGAQDTHIFSEIFEKTFTTNPDVIWSHNYVVVVGRPSIFEYVGGVHVNALPQSTAQGCLYL